MGENKVKKPFILIHLRNPRVCATRYGSTFPRFFIEEGEEKKATIKRRLLSFPVKSVQRREGEGKEETLTARD